MINVIGLGYIGLPTALMLAASGNEVVGTDIDRERINDLNNGIIPFQEKGMEELYQKANNHQIKFSHEYQKTDFYIITVPTPYVLKTKKVDASYIAKAVADVLAICMDNTTLVIESTVSPGTIDAHVRPLVEDHQNKTGETISIVHAPERILPGNMVYELKHNSRTIGCDDSESGQRVQKLYETFCEGEIIITDIRSAEMSKVVENTYRDINIAFANELAKICRSDDLDVYEIIRIANHHPRVNILNPGPGVGGHCISVDPWFLVGDYPELTNLIETARDINDSMPLHVIERIADIMKEHNITDYNKVGLYGISYKANVDDYRESPTLQLLDKRSDLAAPLFRVFDPYVKKHLVDTQQTDFDQFIEESEIIVIMVSHDHLKDHFDKLSNKFVLDTQNMLTNDKDNIYKL